MICYTKLKDREKFLEWLEETGWSRNNSYYNTITNGGWYNDHWQDYFYSHQKIFSKAKNIFEDNIKSEPKSRTKEFFNLIDYLLSIGQKMECWYKDDFACLVGYGSEQRYLMPSDWFEFEELKDYSSLTQSDLKALDGGNNGLSLPANAGNVSKKTLNARSQLLQENMNALLEKERRIKEGTAEELSELKQKMDALMQEMERKKSELMEQLLKKQEELTQKKQELEFQIFLLDTQIYGIRCYLGEVVNFHTIRSGNPAEVDAPIVLYQKIRYLDEEMGKYLSLYDFGDYKDDQTDFIKVLQVRDDIRDLFVPADKSIAVLKLSREGTVLGMSEKAANMLQNFKMYHANQMAVLVRNGENLHIAWLDEERIALQDENLFFNPQAKAEERPYEENSNFLKEESPSESEKLKKSVVSRYFMFSIVQGLTDHGKLLQLPEKINILKPDNRYLIFSMAEGWLKDTRFGTFAEMIDRVTKLDYLEGDMVLTGVNITRDDIYYGSFGRGSNDQTYNNNRGIGDKNRTRGVSIPSMSVLPINKILLELELDVTYERFKCKITPDSSVTNTGELLGESVGRITISADTFNDYKRIGILSNRLMENELIEAVKYYTGNHGDCYYYTDADGIEHLFRRYRDTEKVTEPLYAKKVKSVKIVAVKRHYYLSASKDSWRTDADVRANMRFYWDEAIPLTYLCPTWIRYVITTGNLGDWSIGGQKPTYAQSLRYLNTILAYLDKQQKEEIGALKETGLASWMENNPEWDVCVTEWRMQNHIRKLTPYQAKRFAKYLVKN